MYGELTKEGKNYERVLMGLIKGFKRNQGYQEMSHNLQDEKKPLRKMLIGIVVPFDHGLWAIPN